MYVQSMAEQGNRVAKKKWEAKVPACWMPLTPYSRQYVHPLGTWCQIAQ